MHAYVVRVSMSTMRNADSIGLRMVNQWSNAAIHHTSKSLRLHCKLHTWTLPQATYTIISVTQRREVENGLMHVRVNMHAHARAWIVHTCMYG
jgi:hypothetical protein